MSESYELPSQITISTATCCWDMKRVNHSIVINTSNAGWHMSLEEYNCRKRSHLGWYAAEMLWVMMFLPRPGAFPTFTSNRLEKNGFLFNHTWLKNGKKLSNNKLQNDCDTVSITEHGTVPEGQSLLTRPKLGFKNLSPTVNCFWSVC